MDRLPSDSRAMRREWAGACLTFVGGYLGVASCVAYLLVRDGYPPRGWWATTSLVVGLIVYALIAPVFLGLAAAAGVMAVLSRWHYWRGMYRCHFCDRPLKPGPAWCACRTQEWEAIGGPEIEGRERRRRLQRRRSAIRHYRTRLPRALLALLLLVPAVYTFARLGRPDSEPTVSDLFMLHVMFCNLAMVLGVLTLDALKWMERAKRARLRLLIYVRLIGAWAVFGVLSAAGLD